MQVKRVTKLYTVSALVFVVWSTHAIPAKYIQDTRGETEYAGGKWSDSTRC